MRGSPNYWVQAKNVREAHQSVKTPLYGAKNRAQPCPTRLSERPDLCRTVEGVPALRGGLCALRREICYTAPPEALARSAAPRRAREPAAAKRLPLRTAVGPETPAARARTPSPPVRRPAGHKFGRAAAAARTARPSAIRQRTALSATACARGERGPDAPPTHTAPRTPAAPSTTLIGFAPRRSLTRQKQVVQSTKTPQPNTTRRTPCRP